MKSTLLVCLALISSLFSFGQLEWGNSYMMGDRVNIAIEGETGREGAQEIGAGFHQRAPATRCGFVADPFDTDWDPDGFNGDFFMPGAQENGWGCQIDGVNYGNNYDINEIPHDPLKPVTHVVEGDCITAEWEGSAGGIRFNVKYHLVLSELFYTTEVTMFNESGEDKTDLYYYRNVDPDNNQTIGGTYTTDQTIESQPGDDCQKSLVSATQSLPHDSYVGFGALGDKFRVSFGGFSERDGFEIWNGTGGLTGTLGATNTDDEAISIAYKTDLDDGDSVNFTYAVVLSGDAVEGAFSSLYYIDYESIGGDGGGLINQCNPVVDTVKSCAGNDVTLTVDGPNAGDYDWVWTSDPFDPDAGTDTPTIIVSPPVTTTYTVEGTPISDCLSSSITKTIVVEFSEGPEIEIVDPGPFCDEFDINDLEFTDLNGTIDPNIVFLSEYPDSSSQTEPAFVGPMMGPDDEVWLMIGDTAAGCYDAVLIEINFGGAGAAGNDSTIALCGQQDVFIDLHDMITPGANPLGTFVEETASGQFSAGTGVLNVGGLAGTYVFTYSVPGVSPCPPDEATFTVEVYQQPVADFEYVVLGVSSADGLGSACIISEINFDNNSSAPPGSTWDWDFGDADGSDIEDPAAHTYGAEGTFTITLTITTPDGCTDTQEKEIIIYTEPVLDIIFNHPTCFGFTDGSVTAFVAGGSGTFDIEILDESLVMRNDPGSNTANLLGAGTYTINIEDASGCTATGTVTLIDPLELIPTYRVIPPLCYGDLGVIVIDTVQGEAINNSMYYYWNPVADVEGGPNADSVNVGAGEYVLTINDDKGCSNIVTITMTQPDELLFNSSFGYSPAYCRVYSYQNGGGVVYGAAIGGTGTISYLWEELSTGTTSTNTTWGGRNVGDYKLTITDGNGCVKDSTITVDSLNPIASFTVESAQLNDDCKGTAEVDAVFTNTSLYYQRDGIPGNPRFFWDLDHVEGEDDWYITEDFDEQRDTTYKARGESYEVDVCLITFNQNGCQDMACKTLTIFEPITLTSVNIFTPNGDGDNDLFTFSFYAKSISSFQCVIVNRWGVEVGQITDINQGWDGRDKNGDMCKDGVYFYTYKATADNGDELEGQGNVQIVEGQK